VQFCRFMYTDYFLLHNKYFFFLRQKQIFVYTLDGEIRKTKSLFYKLWGAGRKGLHVSFFLPD